MLALFSLKTPSELQALIFLMTPKMVIKKNMFDVCNWGPRVRDDNEMWQRVAESSTAIFPGEIFLSPKMVGKGVGSALSLAIATSLRVEAQDALNNGNLKNM